MVDLPWYLVLDDIGRRAEALKRKKTHADRIRSKSDDELARYLCGRMCNNACLLGKTCAV